MACQARHKEIFEPVISHTLSVNEVAALFKNLYFRKELSKLAHKTMLLREEHNVV